MIDKKQRFTLSPDVLSQNIDDETVLLDMKSENYFGINEVGGRVLEILKGGANLEDIVEVLLTEYDVKKEELERDVSTYLQQFLDAHLLYPKP